MQRNYQLDNPYIKRTHELPRQTAFHEAGHAASIYLGNKQKNLPPVFFQIEIQKTSDNNAITYAKVVDGHLIHDLPTAGLRSTSPLSEKEQKDFQSAYEADVVNLLVGPLAEAKYVSIRDDEAFNFNLINTQALNYYGGASDVKRAYAYLKYFIASAAAREEKMIELFAEAFQFIENTQNWKLILNLAHHIINSEKDIISCEEAIKVFKQA